MTLAGSGATELRVTPTDTWPGEAALGGEILDGRFLLLGETQETGPSPWGEAQAPGQGVSKAWRQSLHSFTWLRDLRAAGGDAARRLARDLVADWAEHHGAQWEPFIWNPAITGRRLSSWLGHYEFFAASAALDFRHRLLYEVSRQARHLSRALPAGLAGADAIAALKGLILAGLALPNGDAWLRRGLVLLDHEIPRQLLDDGGHVERSPRRLFETLCDLVDLRAALHAAGVTPPESLQFAIESMAPVLRLLQHGDGGLACFNDSNECEDWRIDMVLQRAGGRGRPSYSTIESGFQRLQAGRSLVLVDAGPPPTAGFDAYAHAGTLSFEMSVGRERLIVNCGAHPGGGPWRQAQRFTAAHSTLTIDEVNSSEVARDGSLRRRPELVTCRRDESEGSLWLEMTHDGYRRRFGQIHRRRLYLAAGGDDLRGEDCLDGTRGKRCTVRFHLHPEVKVGLTQRGDAALLRLPKGGGWRLHGEGATMRIEESVYLGQAGEQRRSQQVVLSAAVREGTTVVKWALRREAKSEVDVTPGQVLLAAILVTLAAAALSWLACGQVQRALLRLQIFDRPNARSSHATPVPRGGGLALIPVILLAWLAWSLLPVITPPGLVPVLGGTLILYAVSWIDDRRGLGPAPRFAFQIVAVGLGLAGLLQSDSLFQGVLPLWLDGLVAGLVWLWFVNLFNFMDGIDGISGVEAGVIGFGLSLVALIAGLPIFLLALPLILAGAVAGFLPWNWSPAKIFLGDVGSIPLGYLLGWLLLLTAVSGHWAVALILPAYYLTDATLTLGRRALRGEVIWHAHREHSYQRAVQGGLSHKRVSVLVLRGGLALICCALLAAYGLIWIGLGVAALAVLGLMIDLERGAEGRLTPDDEDDDEDDDLN